MLRIGISMREAYIRLYSIKGGIWVSVPPIAGPVGG